MNGEKCFLVLQPFFFGLTDCLFRLLYAFVLLLFASGPCKMQGKTSAIANEWKGKRKGRKSMQFTAGWHESVSYTFSAL